MRWSAMLLTAWALFGDPHTNEGAEDVISTPEPRVWSVRSRHGGVSMPRGVPEVALFVLMRDGANGPLLGLGLSSDAFVDRYLEPMSGGMRVSVVAAPPTPPVPPPAAAALVAPTQYPSAGAYLDAWSSELAPQGMLVGGVLFAPGVAPKPEAGLVAPGCGVRCGVAVRPGVVVLGTGLDQSTIDSIAASAASGGGSPQARLLRIGARAKELWPGQMPVRSAVYARHGFTGPSGSLPVTLERLRVDDDGRGRAHDRLLSLHHRHLGEVELPREIALAEAQLDAGQTKEAKKHLREAIAVGRKALEAYPREPLWRADVALAMAMLDPKDARALREMEQAVASNRRRADVRLRAAELCRLQGRLDLAWQQLGVAMRLAPDDPVVRAAVESLSALSDG